MTSGVKTSGGDPWNPVAPPGVHKTKTWAGGDGRTEPTLSGVRSKWNNYTLDLAERDVSNNRTVYRHWVNYPSVPAIWVTIDDVYPISVQGNYSYDSNIALKALSRLSEKAKGHSFNLGVFAAEMNKTATLAASTLQKLAKSVMALKRGDFATAARQLGARPKQSKLKSKDISGRWLELQYGWIPLVDDCFEAAKAAEAISNGPRSSTVYASAKDVRILGPSVVGPIQWSERHFRRTSYTYEMYEEMTAARQLGLLDPATVLWEILPYSFVVDWFVPIGTYLDNLNQIPKLVGRFLTSTSYEINIMDIKARSIYMGLPYIEWISVPQVAFRFLSVIRTVSTSLDVPLPSIVNPRSALEKGHRLKNALALAYQAFGSDRT
jgi:hypothetical protein